MERKTTMIKIILIYLIRNKKRKYWPKFEEDYFGWAKLMTHGSNI
jgi:hypothetical protein